MEKFIIIKFEKKNITMKWHIYVKYIENAM